MSVFKVLLENNSAISAVPAPGSEPVDIGLSQDKRFIHWLAIECIDEETAVEVAEKVAKTI
jgi:hypothetical protein